MALGCYRRRMRFDLQPIGVLSSELTSLADAPMQGSEGAPDAWLEVDASFADALRGIEVGDELIVITWFHRALRETLQTHPRSDPRTPLTGVFATHRQTARTRSASTPSPCVRSTETACVSARSRRSTAPRSSTSSLRCQ